MPERCNGCSRAKAIAKLAELSTGYALSDRFFTEDDETANIRQEVMAEQASDNAVALLELADLASRMDCQGTKSILGISFGCRLPDESLGGQSNYGS
jgi:hypothetical protein